MYYKRLKRLTLREVSVKRRIGLKVQAFSQSIGGSDSAEPRFLHHLQTERGSNARPNGVDDITHHLIARRRRVVPIFSAEHGLSTRAAFFYL